MVTLGGFVEKSPFSFCTCTSVLEFDETLTLTAVFLRIILFFIYLFSQRNCVKSSHFAKFNFDDDIYSWVC